MEGGHQALSLEQKRQETPRSLHILLVGLPKSRSERSFLDGYAIGIGEPQAGEICGKPRPIPDWCQMVSDCTFQVSGLKLAAISVRLIHVSIFGFNIFDSCLHQSNCRVLGTLGGFTNPCKIPSNKFH